MVKKIVSLALCVIMLLICCPKFEIMASAGNILDYTQLADPMKTSDEQFFGAWENGVWTKQPILQYNSYPGLNVVEGYAKSGDYVSAKDALMSYYRAKSIKYDWGSPITSPSIQTQMYAEKIIGNQSALASTVFENTGSDAKTLVSFDLTRKGEIQPSYMILDGDKSGSETVLYTRESGQFAPYIRVEWKDAKGSAMVTDIACKGDTYLQYGQADTAFGTSDKMYVFENIAPYGADTKRAYLNFDESLYPQATEVTSIKLNVYATLNGNNTSKQLVLFNAPLMSNMDEKTACWNSITVGTFNYKGAEFDWSKPLGVEFEWINSIARLGQIGNMVRAYQGGCGDVYAYRSLYYILTLYANQVADYPRPLDTAWRTPNVLSALFGLMDSQYMTPEIFTAVLKYLNAMGEALKIAPISGTPNIRHATQVGFYRLVCYVPEVFNGTYRDEAKSRLMGVYNSVILNSDGSYKEGTTGYIGGVMEEMIEAIQMTEATGDEGSVFAADVKSVLGKLARYYADMSQPDGYLTPFGDGGRVSVRSIVSSVGNMVDDPELIWFGSGFKSGKMPDYSSVWYRDKKMAIMRSNWSRSGFYAAMNAICGGGHSHPDDLNLDIYAYGKQLIVDPGNGGGYNPSSPAAYVRTSTLAHNTVEVDGLAQTTNTNTDTSMDFVTNGDFDFAVGSTAANAGVIHERKVLFIRNSYWIVTDVMRATDGNAHTYKQAWHPDVYNNLTLNPETKVATTNFSSGANISIVPMKHNAVTAVKDLSYMRSRKQVNVLSDYVYYGFSGSGTKTVGTVLYPQAVENSASIVTEQLPLSDGAGDSAAYAAKITIDGEKNATYYVSNEKTPLVRSFGNYTFGGEMLYTEQNPDGKISMICLRNGSELTDTRGNKLISADEVLSDISVKWLGNKMSIESSSDITQPLKIYSPIEVSGVSMNGKDIPFISNWTYVYINSGQIKLDVTKTESGTMAIMDGAELHALVSYKGALRHASLIIPDNTMVTGPPNWDGTISFYATVNRNTLNMYIGDENIKLEFDKAVTMRVPTFLPEGATYISDAKIGAFYDANVSAIRNGNVTDVFTKVNGKFIFVNSGLEVAAITNIDCLEDTYTRRGSSYQNTNYAQAQNIDITSHTWTSSSNYSSFVKFKYGWGVGENPEDIQNAERITLTLSFSSAPSHSGILSSYGLYNSYEYSEKFYNAKEWTADTLTGANAHVLYGLGFFEDNACTTNITGNEGKNTSVTIDVTNYVKSQKDGVFAFKLGATSDTGLEVNRWQFYSSESTVADNLKPHLTMYMPEQDYKNNKFELEATADAQTRYNSSGQDTNYGSSTQLGLYSYPPQDANCRMSFIRFDNAEYSKDIMGADAVYLDLKIRSVESNSSGGKINVYGLIDSYTFDGASYDYKTGWTEKNITGAITKANKMATYTDHGVSYDILSTTKAGTEIRIDVTDYVRTQKDGIYVFKLSTEGASGNPLNLTLHSREGAYAPKLSVVKSLAVEDVLADIEENAVPVAVTKNFAVPAYGTHGSALTWEFENSAVTMNLGTAKVTQNNTDTLGSVTLSAEKFERKISETYYFAVKGTTQNGIPNGIRFENKENQVIVTAYVYADKITPNTRLLICKNTIDGGRKLEEVHLVSEYDVRSGIARFTESVQSVGGDTQKFSAYLTDIQTMEPKLNWGIN